jgi:hypothetical protein
MRLTLPSVTHIDLLMYVGCAARANLADSQQYPEDGLD